MRPRATADVVSLEERWLQVAATSYASRATAFECWMVVSARQSAMKCVASGPFVGEVQRRSDGLEEVAKPSGCPWA